MSLSVKLTRKYGRALRRGYWTENGGGDCRAIFSTELGAIWHVRLRGTILVLSLTRYIAQEGNEPKACFDVMSCEYGAVKLLPVRRDVDISSNVY